MVVTKCKDIRGTPFLVEILCVFPKSIPYSGNAEENEFVVAL